MSVALSMKEESLKSPAMEQATVFILVTLTEKCSGCNVGHAGESGVICIDSGTEKHLPEGNF